MTGYDTALHLRTDCASAASEVSCNDDTEGQAGKLVQTLDAGAYYLWADSYGEPGGAFQLDYSFHANPCAGDPCPGTPECVPDASWASFSCLCPAGTVPHNAGCIDDPCQPNPCTATAHKQRCAAVLPGNHQCLCNIGYIDDGSGSGGCVLDPNANDWTFMVYLNADNNLEDDGYDDITEMMAVGSTPNVHIVVLLDSYSRDGGEARILYVTQGGTQVIENRGEIDMSDWHTLRDFGVWTVQHYPARHYALVMWDHGGGWKSAQPKQPILKGFSNDDHGTAGEISVSNGDYASALEGITNALGGKLDLIGFDACLMGMYEVAAVSAPYGRVFVGSSETEPGSGWAYDDFLPGLTANPSMPAKDLGISVVNAYFNESDENSTLAVSDLETMTALHAAVTGFANALKANPSLYAAFESARTSTQSFTDDEFRDLQDFAERVAATSSAPRALRDAANALVAQLQLTVVLSRAQAGYPKAHGLSIYLPGRSGSVDRAYTDAGALWSQLTTWDEFLAHYTTH
ncbi:MAG: hypothetical protein HY901_34245 [Deltaproteobacteria bacterium]|nr:hypothetical protein [Deltaproteobacteria bacterium]